MSQAMMSAGLTSILLPPNKIVTIVAWNASEQTALPLQASQNDGHHMFARIVMIELGLIE